MKGKDHTVSVPGILDRRGIIHGQSVEHIDIAEFGRVGIADVGIVEMDAATVVIVVAQLDKGADIAVNPAAVYQARLLGESNTKGLLV